MAFPSPSSPRRTWYGTRWSRRSSARTKRATARTRKPGRGLRLHPSPTGGLSMLHLRLAACMILLCLAAVATGPSSARDKGGQQAATRAYVETSYLIAPRRIGDFTLEGAQYDKDRKYAGAGFRYRVDGHQEIRVDIFVYPAGRMSQEAALDAGMQAFRTDLDRAVEAKAYDNLVVVDERDFPLRGDPPASGNEPGAPVEADEAAILEAIGAASRIEGRKLAMTLDIQPQGW